MKWIKKDEQNGSEVTLPATITPGIWTAAAVQGHDYQICWEPSLRTLFVRTSEHAPEVPLKYRAVHTERFSGDVFCDVLLEYVGGTESLARLVQSQVAIHVPGLNQRQAAAGAAGETIRSPMVGKVLRILVEDGQIIDRGHELLVIEAMKMENKIFARSSGTVKDIHIEPGAQVSVGQVLVRISP